MATAENSVTLKEEADGGLVIDGLEALAFGETEVVEETSKKPPVEDAKPAATDDEDDEPHAEGATDAEKEAIRERRRIERSERKRQQQQRNREWAELKEHNKRLEQQIAQLAQSQRGNELARLDNDLAGINAALQSHELALAEAISRGEGTAAAAAQRKIQELSQASAHLTNMRGQYTQQPQRQQQAPQQRTLPPEVELLGMAWRRRNSEWYEDDPEAQRMALAVDKTVERDGFDPGTEEYWQELDKRLDKHLPDRLHGTKNRATVPASRKPASPVAGSGKESASSSGGVKRSFTLSKERVEALKAAGMGSALKDPKQLADIVRRYAEYDETHPSK